MQGEFDRQFERVGIKVSRGVIAANCVAITVGEHELDVIIETIGDEAIQVFAAKGQAKELGTDEAATDDGDIALFRLMADTLETPKGGQYSCGLSLVMGVSR